MEMLDHIDTLLAALLHFGVFLFVILRMNKMYGRKTPHHEKLVWWCLGTGSFSEIMLYLTGSVSGWGGVLTGTGVLFLVGMLTQSEWRAYLFNRRVNPEEPLPPGCDRRCQTFMGTRRDERTFPWAT